MSSEYDHCFGIIDYFDKGNNPFDKQLLITIKLIQIVENINNKNYINAMNKTFINNKAYMYKRPIDENQKKLEYSLNYYINDVYHNLFNHLNNIIISINNGLLNESIINYLEIYKNILNDDDNKNDFYNNIKLLVMSYLDIIYKDYSTYLNQFINLIEYKGFKVIFVYGDIGYNTLLYSIFKKYLLIPLPHKGNKNDAINFLQYSTSKITNIFATIINDNSGSLNINFDMFKKTYQQVICSNLNKQIKKIIIFTIYTYIYCTPEKFNNNMKDRRDAIINYCNERRINFQNMKTSEVVEEMITFFNIGYEQYINQKLFSNNSCYTTNVVNDNYNKEIGIIINFIEYRKSESTLHEDVLLNYFNNGIDNYINSVRYLKDFIYGNNMININNYLSNSSNFRNLDYIENNPISIFERIKKSITVYNRQTNRDKILNTKYIFDIIIDITRVLCSQINDNDNDNSTIDNDLYNYQSNINTFDNLNNSIISGKEFILFFSMDNSGLFGINTYLHAFFNKVAILGIPVKTTKADNFNLCPMQFFNHDIRHHLIMTYSLLYQLSEPFNLYKHIYNEIINSVNLSNNQKEKFILFIWILIHEYMSFIIPKGYFIHDKSSMINHRKFHALDYVIIESVDALIKKSKNTNFNALSNDFSEMINNILTNNNTTAFNYYNIYGLSKEALRFVHKDSIIFNNITNNNPGYNFEIFLVTTYNDFINIKKLL